MTRDDEPCDPPEDDRSDFVPAVLARNLDEADRYQELLNDHDIPAIIGKDQDDHDAQAPSPCRKGMARGVPVLVPEVFLDEASEIIADLEDLDEFAGGDEDRDEHHEDHPFGFVEENLSDRTDHPFADDEDDDDDDDEDDEDLFGEDDDHDEEELEDENP